MAARSTPTTTPTTAPCPHQTWTNTIASSSTTRADAHWALPLTTWCWSFTRKMGMKPSALSRCRTLTLHTPLSLSLHPRLCSGNWFWIPAFEKKSNCTLKTLGEYLHVLQNLHCSVLKPSQTTRRAFTITAASIFLKNSVNFLRGVVSMATSLWWRAVG